MFTSFTSSQSHKNVCHNFNKLLLVNRYDGNVNFTHGLGPHQNVSAPGPPTSLICPCLQLISLGSLHDRIMLRLESSENQNQDFTYLHRFHIRRGMILYFFMLYLDCHCPSILKNSLMHLGKRSSTYMYSATKCWSEQ